MAAEAEYRCFIGGLSWSTTDRDLEEAFRPYGNILEAKVVLNRDTGRSKGFGFVTFRDEREMEEAIDRMHGFSLDGRSITVDKAQDKASGGGGKGFGGGGGSQDCFKCGQPDHWARECPNSGSGRRYGDSGRDRYGSGGGGSRYGSDRNEDRYSGRSSTGRENGSRDRYSSGGPARTDGGSYRDRSGPYEREASGKYGGGSARNDSRSYRSSNEDRD